MFDSVGGYDEGMPKGSRGLGVLAALRAPRLLGGTTPNTWTGIGGLQGHTDRWGTTSGDERQREHREMFQRRYPQLWMKVSPRLAAGVRRCPTRARSRCRATTSSRSRSQAPVRRSVGRHGRRGQVQPRPDRATKTAKGVGDNRRDHAARRPRVAAAVHGADAGHVRVLAFPEASGTIRGSSEYVIGSRQPDAILHFQFALRVQSAARTCATWRRHSDRGLLPHGAGRVAERRLSTI